MKTKTRLLISIVCMGLLLTSCQNPPSTVAPLTGSAVETDTETTLYLDPLNPIEVRVEDLLARMTLDEKIGQMTLVEKNSITPQAVAEFMIGGLLSGGGGHPPINDAEHWAEMVNGFQMQALETRLSIPLIYGVDAVHGHGNLYGATIFPHNIGLGASHDTDLLFRIGQITAQEMAATGIWWNYAPVLAVPQDIRWGRTYEAYSSDSALVAALGAAYIRGLQGSDLSDPLTVLATPKHFVGDGGTIWGSSRTGSYEIDQGDAVMDEETLRLIHLSPYQEAIEAGALSIMLSYSSWNGQKMHAQKYLITDVLKGEMGFTGFVVSDWGAIDQVDSNYYEAVVKAINAGVDINMVPTKYVIFIQALKAAVENGDVSQERIDDAVRRILRAKFELGLFEHPFSDPALLGQVGSEAHRDVAREAVAKSLVLLQNENNALPLSKTSSLIFVAGAAADNIGIQTGGWTIEWQGQLAMNIPGVTILEAIEQSASAETTVQFNRFGKYDRIMDENGNPAIADIGIVVVGETPYAEGVGDREDLSLSDTDAQLIARVRERADILIVILISGRPLIITDILPMADAWVAAWLPGTEGLGITDVLFGDLPFSGSLSFNWPASMDQVPIGNSSTPYLFPLGFGLAP